MVYVVESPLVGCSRNPSTGRHACAWRCRGLKRGCRNNPKRVPTLEPASYVITSWYSKRYSRMTRQRTWSAEVHRRRRFLIRLSKDSRRYSSLAVFTCISQQQRTYLLEPCRFSCDSISSLVLKTLSIRALRLVSLPQTTLRRSAARLRLRPTGASG